MNKIVLATKRRWNWKVFFVLVGLIIPATFAIWPYTSHQQNISLGWDLLVIDRLINVLIFGVLGGIGLVLANRIGLGMPFVEGWAKDEPMPYRFCNVVAVAVIMAAILVVLSMFLHTVVFDPPVNAMLEEMGIDIPEAASTPPLYGFLAAISAGITEETEFRLFGLSLLAWLGGLLFHDLDGRPKLVIFWTANILFALAFGAVHLVTEAAMGIPITPLVVTATLVLNGMGGLVFGWLFWTMGLESAMLSHILADILRHSLIPFILVQEGETAKTLAVTGVVVLILLALVWAWRTLSVKERIQSASSELRRV
jgi:CAAX prenyl protease-like protein